MKPVTFTEKMLPAPKNGGFRMEGYWVWCGSVIKGEDGRYHIFASRWPKTHRMHPGWLVASEVVRASCDNPCGPYTFEEVVLPARGPDYWDGRSTHCPAIIKCADTYVLYYTGMTHPFEDIKPDEKIDPLDPRAITGRASKRVGIATSKSVFGPWRRRDKPILPTRPGMFDSFMTSNPAPCVNPDGSILLVYKARAYNPPPYEGLLHGSMTLGVATANSFDDEYIRCCDKPILPPEMEVEDPFVWPAQGGGYHMIAKDMHGKICGERHGGIYAHSPDGKAWQIAQEIRPYSRLIRWDDGTQQMMGSLERASILFEGGSPTCMFFATADGPGGFHCATDTWNIAVPLEVSQ